MPGHQRRHARQQAESRKLQELADKVDAASARGTYIDGKLAPTPEPDTRSMTLRAPESPGAISAPHGPVAALLRRELQAQVNVREHVRRLLAHCEPPGPNATAADRRVSLDAAIYVTNQLIGAPRQAVDITTDERQVIQLVWGQAAEALADVIEGEATVVDASAVPAEAEDAADGT